MIKIIRVLAGIIFSLLIVDLIASIITGPGNNIGGFFGLIASILVVIYCIFFIKINAFLKPRKIIRTIVVTVLLAGISYISIMTVLMVKHSSCPPPSTERTVVVVLGCKVNGSSPSLMLSNRINTAYEYLSEHPEAICICSGGQGPDEGISEAQCIRDELVRLGIDSTRLYLEDKSTSTRENLKFSKSIMVEKNLGNSVLIVTDSFHEYRAYLIAKDLGLHSGGIGVSTPLWLLPCYYFREMFAIAHQIFL